MAKSEDPWALGKQSAQLSAFLHLLPWRVRRGLRLPGSLCPHALPLARRKGGNEEGEEGREEKEKEGGGGKKYLHKTYQKLE